MHSIYFTFTSKTPFEGILDGYMNNVKLQVAVIQKKKNSKKCHITDSEKLYMQRLEKEITRRNYRTLKFKFQHALTQGCQFFGALILWAF